MTRLTDRLQDSRAILLPFKLGGERFFRRSFWNKVADLPDQPVTLTMTAKLVLVFVCRLELRLSQGFWSWYATLGSWLSELGFLCKFPATYSLSFLSLLILVPKPISKLPQCDTTPFSTGKHQREYLLHLLCLEPAQL